MSLIPSPLLPLCRFVLFLLAGSTASLAAPVITEFMASNGTTHTDEDGDYSDWIEIHNPDTTAVSLDGWYLTDNSSNKTKWQFPAVSIPANGYLLVYASDKNRRTPGQPLHTSYGLSADGEYLGLIAADGTTVVSEFAPAFPPQFRDLSYGITQPTAAGETPQIGYFSTPTPGARNGDASTLTIVESVTFSAPSGPFLNQLSLELTGAAAGQKIRYTLVSPSSTGAEIPAPTATSQEYTGPLFLTDSVIISAAVFSADGARRGLVSTAHYVKTDSNVAHFSSQLPIMVLDGHGFGDLERDDIKHPAWLHVFEPIDGEATLDLPTFSTRLTAKVRGFSSSLFPKKSYNLELWDNSGAKRSQPLLSLPAATDWAIVGPWHFDRPAVRNAYIYALSNRIGRWAPRTKFFELFFNWTDGILSADDYRGIMVLTDRIKIDPERVDIAELSGSDNAEPDVTGGYLMKIDGADPDEFNFVTARGIPHPAHGSTIVVADPKLDKITPAQQSYIQNYIQGMEDALYADHAGNWSTRRYLDFLDRDSWVDFHLLNVFTKNGDGLRRSAYFYKDRGGKLIAGPLWDFDRSMGSNDGESRDLNVDTWGHGESIQLWTSGWWAVLTRDPDFLQSWIDRWQSLRRNEFADDRLTGLLDELANTIGADAGARDFAKWDYRSTFEAEITHLRNWLLRRARWIDQQFLATPSVALDGDELVVTPPPGAVLIYRPDGADPRASSGEPSAGAITSAQALRLPVGTNARVRAYRADLADLYPGSPWSAALVPSADDLREPSSVASSISLRPFGRRNVTANAGTSAVLGIAASGPGPFSYSWFKDGERLPDSNSPELTIENISTADAGLYTVEVYNGIETVVSEPFTVEVTYGTTLAAIASRAEVSGGENVLIAGFVVEGTGTKRYLARAVGPALAAQGVAQPLAAPVLRVYSRDGEEIASNTGWQNAPDAAALPAIAEQLGAFPLPPGGADSALLLDLQPGLYTLHAASSNSASGVALAELYALNEQSRPIALSSRARVRPGENILIGGVVVGGPAAQRLLLRAVGPALSAQGVAQPLPDPVLEVVRNGVTLHTNDDWDSTDTVLVETIAATGTLPFTPGGKDAALVVELPPGAYSVLVKGKGSDEGVALVEIYTVPVDE